MSLMYHDGIGYPVDLDKSFELAEKAAVGGDPLGYFDSAQGGDSELAVEYLESIADNNAEAAGKLSDYYKTYFTPVTMHPKP